VSHVVTRTGAVSAVKCDIRTPHSRERSDQEREVTSAALAKTAGVAGQLKV
jgi:hypothetical protein